MDDSATRLSSQFERAGLAVLLAVVLAVSGLIWLYLPDRTTSSFSSSQSSTTGPGAVELIAVEENSIVDTLRRLERILHPELSLLILVGVALACAVPLVTRKPTVSFIGCITCGLGQLLGALFALAGVAASVDVVYQEHGFDTLARPLNHLNAAALAAVGVVLARMGANPIKTKRSRRPVTRVKRPVPRPLGVPRESHSQ